jgi:hypothetical protein
MNYDELSDLPEWDDEEFRDQEEEEEGEGWKPNPTREACKALYEQWQQVMIVLNGALDSMTVEEKEDGFPADYWEDHKGMLTGDAFQVAVKIKSSESGDMYMLRMENAGIIRKNAQFIKSSMLTMISEGVIEEAHGRVIRDEIDKFRFLFKHWVSTFQKDEFEDEWGLYI